MMNAIGDINVEKKLISMHECVCVYVCGVLLLASVGELKRIWRFSIHLGCFICQTVNQVGFSIGFDFIYRRSGAGFNRPCDCALVILVKLSLLFLLLSASKVQGEIVSLSLTYQSSTNLFCWLVHPSFYMTILVRYFV